MNEAICTFPTKSVGPAKPSSPLSLGLVRVVFGDPRTATAALTWTTNPPKTAVYLQVESVGGCAAKTQLVVHPDSTVLEAFADFDCKTLNDFSLVFQAFTKEDGGGECIGSAIVMGIELGELCGVLKRPIISNATQIVGVLTIEFNIIKPLVTPISKYDFNIAASKHSRSRPIPYFTGHRGMGKTKPDLPLENTIASFIESACNPFVNMIELDVQLSSDGHAVVYHDWFFRNYGRDNDEDKSNLAVPLYNLTLQQFRELHKSGTRSEKHMPFNTQLLTEICSNNADVVNEIERNTVRTLEQVCVLLPTDIGIMVEIKYPSPNVQQQDNIPFAEQNEIVDRVLHSLFSVPQNAYRQILFLTFHADIAQMLRLKQSTFPVFFSHCAARDKPCEMLDPRCTSIRQGIEFCRTLNLQGIMFFNRILETEPEAVDEAIDAGLQVITYGSANSDAKWAVEQFEMGVESVIVDRAPALVKNAIPLMNDAKVQAKKNLNKPMLVSNGTLVALDEIDALSSKFVDYNLFK